MRMTIRQEWFPGFKLPRQDFPGHTSGQQDASIMRPIHDRDRRLKPIDEAIHWLLLMALPDQDRGIQPLSPVWGPGLDARGRYDLLFVQT